MRKLTLGMMVAGGRTGFRFSIFKQLPDPVSKSLEQEQRPSLKKWIRQPLIGTWHQRWS